MIKKNDLVKQFELVVKQEITNHNEQISNANQRMNYMDNSVKELFGVCGDLKESFTKLGMHVHEHIKDDIQQKTFIMNQCKKYESNFEDLLDAHFDIKKNIDYHLEYIDEIKKEFQHRYEESIQHFQNIFLESLSTVKKIDEKCDHHFRKFHSEVDKKIQDSDKSTCIEALNFKNDKLRSLVEIEISGFKKELEKLKKQNFRNEKHIEFLESQLKEKK